MSHILKNITIKIYIEFWIVKSNLVHTNTGYLFQDAHSCEDRTTLYRTNCPCVRCLKECCSGKRAVPCYYTCVLSWRGTWSIVSSKMFSTCFFFCRSLKAATLARNRAFKWNPWLSHQNEEIYLSKGMQSPFQFSIYLYVHFSANWVNCNKQVLDFTLNTTTAAITFCFAPCLQLVQKDGKSVNCSIRYTQYFVTIHF